MSILHESTLFGATLKALPVYGSKVVSYTQIWSVETLCWYNSLQIKMGCSTVTNGSSLLTYINGNFHSSVVLHSQAQASHHKE